RLPVGQADANRGRRPDVDDILADPLPEAVRRARLDLRQTPERLRELVRIGVGVRAPGISRVLFAEEEVAGELVDRLLVADADNLVVVPVVDTLPDRRHRLELDGQPEVRLVTGPDLFGRSFGGGICEAHLVLPGANRSIDSK